MLIIYDSESVISKIHKKLLKVSIEDFILEYKLSQLKCWKQEINKLLKNYDWDAYCQVFHKKANIKMSERFDQMGLDKYNISEKHKNDIINDIEVQIFLSSKDLLDNELSSMEKQISEISEGISFRNFRRHSC